VALLAVLLAPGRADALSPELTGTASILLPGLGQAINEDYVPGALQFGTAMVLANQYIRLREDDRFIDFDDRVDEETKTIRVNRVTFEADFYAFALLNLSFYSAFGAYRDGRLALGNEGYNTPAPQESLQELALSPFRWEFLKRPTTLAPLFFPLLFALTDAGDGRYVFKPDSTISRDELAVGFFGIHEMVAVGEESFFRGMLNNGFSSSLGELWGLGVSSALFGLAHEGDPGQATALGAAVFGVYVGYLQQANDYRIGQGVAIHFWWNFFTSLGMLRSRAPDELVPLFNIYLRY
jgi:membrane protease YdiL (CAAX protease family)